MDKKKVAVMGGSHGGFLTGNLVGQYPEFFKCGVLRNPVMDLGLMIHCSDIPDWTYVEAFGSKVMTNNRPISITTSVAHILQWLAMQVSFRTWTCCHGTLLAYSLLALHSACCTAKLVKCCLI